MRVVYAGFGLFLGATLAPTLPVAGFNFGRVSYSPTMGAAIETSVIGC